MRATSLIRIVQLGVKSLLLHKMRSGLTMLGIIFGVCSVIAMLAIGEGASYEAQEAIKKLGSSNIILRSIKPAQDSKTASAGRSYVNEYGITYADVARLDGTIPGIRRVLPMRIIRDEVRFNNLVQQGQIIGTHPTHPRSGGTRAHPYPYLARRHNPQECHEAVRDRLATRQKSNDGDTLLCGQP